MTNFPRAARAADSARAREIIKALRDVPPPPPSWEHEREVLAEAGGPRPLAGAVVTHEPENRRFIVHGTICDIVVTPPFIGGYEHVPSVCDAGHAAVRAVCRVTGEGFNDVLFNGRHRWSGPDG
jgi:hypothetical protein